MRTLALLAAFAVSSALPALAQWQLQSSPTTADLRGIDNVGNGIAWASGTNGTILRSTDSGLHWQRCTTPPNADHLDFRGIQAFDATTAIAMSSGTGDLSRLYKTTDACLSWTLLFTNPDKTGFWDEIALVAKRHKKNLSAGGPRGTIFILGDPVKSHFVIWEVHDPSKPGQLPRKLSLLPVATPGETVFAASNSVMLHMTMAPAFGLPVGFAFATGGTHGSHWLRITGDISDDIGDDLPVWKSRDIPIGEGDGYIGSGTDCSGVFSVAFRYSPEQGIMRYLGPKTSYLAGLAVGGDYMKPNDITANAAYTNNGGQLWIPATTQPHGYRSAVAYDAPTKTWITVGPNGTDISTDDGRNWRALHPSNKDAPDADQHWNALSLPFVVGPHGRVGVLSPTALKPVPAR
jgi:photosystem II stability/assembly factor-like uncharacterized protein